MLDISRTRHQCRNLRGNSLLAVLAVILTVSVLTAAGFWQLHRAHYKDQLQARAEAALKNPPIDLSGTKIRAEDVEFRSIHVRGEWLPDHMIFIDNKIQNGVVGYYVVTPFKIVPGDLCVLVNRGWVAAPPLRSELPAITTPAGPADINGIARAPTGRFIELSKQSSEGEQGRVWQNLTIDRFEAWSGLALQPVVLFQQDVSDNDLQRGLQRVPVAPEASGLNADRHRGYALTWFALAVVTLILAIAAKRKSKKS